MKVYDCFKEDEITGDVLERISGYESFIGTEKEEGARIFSIEVLTTILFSEEDDTNETTKHRIRQLYDYIPRTAGFFMIKK